MNTQLPRGLVLGYGLFCYLAHWAAVIYLIGFIGNLWFRKTIDSGARQFASVYVAVIVNCCAMLCFLVPHWIMARPWFKQWWLRYIAAPIERSTYVLVTCITLGMVFAIWQPIGSPVWNSSTATALKFLQSVYLFGWILATLATFPINHWELFGLRQAWLYWQNLEYFPPKPKSSVIYRYLPHPIFVGYAIAFWAAPTMSYGHFLLSAMLSLFILIDLRLAADEN